MKHAVGLFRLPLNVPTYVEPDGINNVCFNSLSLKLDDIALEMQNERILAEVFRAILDEWSGETVIALKSEIH